MRIDYSEPRQSYGSSASSPHASRKSDSSSGSSLLTFLVLGGIIFVTGFGTGWYFSQKSAKKAFRAAMEQQSLESVAQAPKKQPETQQPQTIQPAAATPTVPQQNQPGTTSQQASPTGQVPLSFFESLPKGQKQAVLGSGINEKPKSAPPAVPQPPPAPSAAASTPKPVDTKNTSSGFIVQVAAFNSAREAEAAKAKLLSKGYSASISEINLNEKGTWYRVRIGRHLEKESATEIANRIGGGAKILPDQE